MSDTWTDVRENLGQDPTFDTDVDWDFVPEPSPTREQVRAWSSAADYAYPAWL